MPTALILYGPKAVGKSWIAQVLAEQLGVYHLDPDELIARLLAAGKQPDPHVGWLAEVAAHAQDALANHDLVSVEATGAWLEANWVYDAATARAASTRFDLKIDTGSGITPAQVIEAVRPLVAEQQP